MSSQKSYKHDRCKSQDRAYSESMAVNAGDISQDSCDPMGQDGAQTVKGGPCADHGPHHVWREIVTGARPVNWEGDAVKESQDAHEDEEHCP